MLPEAFHPVSAQENIWFRRYCLKNSKRAVKDMSIFDGINSYSESPYCRKPFIKFLNKGIYGLEEYVG